MRQLFVQVPRGCGQRALDIARNHGGVSLALLEASADTESLDLVLIHLSNDKIDPLLEDLQQIRHLHVAFAPHAVITLKPPPDVAPEQVTQVGRRSPVEIFMGGLQSVGSWTGLLGYAAASAIVVWIGFFTNTIFLLVAAMLISPFAAPAMNAALATARGDAVLLRRSVIRYFASLIVTAAVTATLSLILLQDVATELMVRQSMVSSVAVLLPLVAGAAGALNLCQSERSSLVSGAATGMLVAASLAPPAGLVGMAAAIGEWDMAKNALFLLLLQLVGINLAGAVVFRLFHLSPIGARYERGQPWISWTTWSATAIVLALLLAWQFHHSPDLQRSSVEQRAASVVHTIVNANPRVALVEANARFTRADIPRQNTLLIVLYVQRHLDADITDEQIRQQLEHAIHQHLRERDFNVTPLVDVRVLQPRPLDFQKP